MDTKIIYSTGNKDAKKFDWGGWTYYRTKTGKPKRQSGKIIEFVDEEEFICLKEQFEKVLGVTVEA